MSKYFMGVDIAEGQDYSCYQVFKRPSRLRKLLRRIRLDRSTWQMKLVKQWFTAPKDIK